jgi:hypothetical protein
VKFVLTFLFITTLASVGFAADYSCFAKANPERGFSTDFEVTLKPAAVGGELILKINGNEIPMAKISDARRIESSDASMADAFNLTLGLLGEEDVSGLTATEIAKVTALGIFYATAANGDELMVYQYFIGNTPAGGTFFAASHGTACIKN